MLVQVHGFLHLCGGPRLSFRLLALSSPALTYRGHLEGEQAVGRSLFLFLSPFLISPSLYAMLPFNINKSCKEIKTKAGLSLSLTK